MSHRAESMLGPGGKIRVPLSESSEIDKVLFRLRRIRSGDDHDIQLLTEAEAILTRLRTQVSQGYHRNPSEHQHKACHVMGVIGKDVHSIAYRHAADGKPYKHDFEPGSAEALAVLHYGFHDILIRSRTGDPLWDDF